MENQKKHLTPQQAYIKVQSLCAYQDRCQQEVRDKLYEWGLHEQEIENIIANLITENFINEERFSIAYAGGKFRIKKWGRIKIKQELKKRKISEYCIKKALHTINSDEYLKTIQHLFEKKLRDIKNSKEFIKKHKAAQYVISKGFEQDLVYEVIKLES